MNIKLQILIQQIPEDSEERVDLIRKRMNPILREAIRKETGLLLNRHEMAVGAKASDELVTVPIRLIPGIPRELKDFTLDADYQLAVLISRFATPLKNMQNDAKQIANLIKELETIPMGAEILASRQRHIPPVEELVSDLVALMEKMDLAKKILSVDRDILGAYFYNASPLFSNHVIRGIRIELYWAIIALIAQCLGVTIENLATVVLAHEIGHAYTHIGSDIDGLRWRSQEFAETEHALKEGLAQYYTYRVCTRLREQNPGVYETYERLLKKQSQSYQTHLHWLEYFKPEDIRLAMLAIRREGRGSVARFDDVLGDARDILKQRNEVL
jgi:hypothetical protein